MQTNNDKSEENLSSSVLLDLLRDHNSEIGNWCEIVNENQNQDMPLATIESFKSQYTIDENGPFYIFASNLNFRPFKLNAFDLHEQIYQHFGGKENLFAVYIYQPWARGCCMLMARDYEACIRVLRKDGEEYRDKQMKVEYVLSNMDPLKYTRFDSSQLDAQLQMYRLAHPPPPPEVPKPKPNPFGKAEPVDTQAKLKMVEDKLRKEDNSIPKASLTTSQQDQVHQPKVGQTPQPQPATQPPPPRILHHSDSHGSGGGGNIRVVVNSNISGNNNRGGGGRRDMAPFSSKSNNTMEGGGIRKSKFQQSSSQQTNPRPHHSYSHVSGSGSTRIFKTSLRAAQNNGGGGGRKQPPPPPDTAPQSTPSSAPNNAEGGNEKKVTQNNGGGGQNQQSPPPPDTAPQSTPSSAPDNAEGGNKKKIPLPQNNGGGSQNQQSPPPPDTAPQSTPSSAPDNAEGGNKKRNKKKGGKKGGGKHQDQIINQNRFALLDQQMPGDD